MKSRPAWREAAGGLRGSDGCIAVWGAPGRHKYCQSIRKSPLAFLQRWGSEKRSSPPVRGG